MGPAPSVKAMSCTVCLRNIHAANNVPSLRSSIVSDRPKPSEVEAEGQRHVGDGDVHVVDAVDADTPPQVVALDESLDLVHLVHQLDQKPSGSRPHRRAQARWRSRAHAAWRSPLVEPFGEVQVLRSTIAEPDAAHAAAAARSTTLWWTNSS